MYNVDVLIFEVVGLWCIVGRWLEMILSVNTICGRVL